MEKHYTEITLAYFGSTVIDEEKSFMTLTPGLVARS
jgi:hypothetical protein